MITLILLEDKPSVRYALVRQLERQDVSVLAPEVLNASNGGNIDAIRAVFSNRPDGVIIDLVWETQSGDEVDALEVLREALRGMQWRDARPVPAFLLSGFRYPAEICEGILSNWRQTLKHRLDIRGFAVKPISGDDLLNLLPIGRTPPPQTVELDIRLLELPVRLIDGSGDILASNQHWSWGLNEPDPNPVRAHHGTKAHRRSQRGREFLVPRRTLSQLGSSADDRLIPYRLEEVACPDNFALQIAYPIDNRPDRHPSRARSAFLAGLFENLQQIGFTRMRYYERYRVPRRASGHDEISYDTQVALLHWYPHQTGNYPKPKGRRQRKPILAPGVPPPDHFSLFDTNDADLKKLIYRLSSANQQDGGDASFSSTTYNDDQYAQVVVPILRRIEGHRTHYHAEAMLELDRHGHPERQNVDIDDMRWAEVPLLMACNELRDMLQRERNNREMDATRRIRKLYKEAHSLEMIETAPSAFAELFVRHALEICDADDGVLFWTPHPDRVPELLALASGPRQRGGRSLADHLHYGACLDESLQPAAGLAWRHKTEIFLPHFESEGEAGGREATGSRVGIPLRVGETMFGALELRHHEPLHFRMRRINILRQLVELFVHPLRFAAEQQDRRNWENVLVHDLRTNIVGARNWLDRVAQEHPEVKKADGLRATSSLLKRSLDMTQALMDLQNPRLGAHSKVFVPDTVVREEVPDFEPMATARGCKIILELRGDDASVHGNETAMRMIIRILVHNAIHHGESGAPVTVTSTTNEDGKWQLRIVNRGHMSEDADANKWIPYYQTRHKRRSGVHIGLAAARKWANAMNVELDVKNAGNNSVEARLVWPTT